MTTKTRAGWRESNLDSLKAYSTIELTADGWVYRGHCHRGETIAY